MKQRISARFLLALLVSIAISISFVFFSQRTLAHREEPSPLPLVLPHTAPLAASITDMCFGASDCSTAPISIDSLTFTLRTDGKYDATGTLKVRLPGQSLFTSAVTFVTDDDQGTNPSAMKPIPEITINISGGTLKLTDIAVNGNGLTFGSGSFAMPESLGKTTGILKDIAITKDGLSIGGAAAVFTLPDIHIGDGSKVKMTSNTARLQTETDGYSLSITGMLAINLSQNTTNNSTVQATLHSNGDFKGTVNSLVLTVAGSTLSMQNVLLTNNGLNVAQASIQLPQQLGNAKGTVNQVSITKDGLKIGGGAAEFDLPDINIGDGSTVKIASNKAQLVFKSDDYSFGIASTLQIRLPGNSQDVRIKTTIDNKGNFNGNLDKLILKLSSASLIMEKVVVDSTGLNVQTAMLQLPPSFGNTNGTVNDVKITKDGLSISGGAVQLPDIKIGGGSKVMIEKPTATIKSEADGYSFGINGILVINVPENNQRITFAGTISRDGQLSGKVDTITLKMASATLTLKNSTLNNDGLTVASGLLKLPSAFNGVEGEVQNIAINDKGVSIGGGSARIPFKDFTIGSSSGNAGFSVTNTTLKLELTSDHNFVITLNGTVHVQVPGASSTATGTISVDRNGKVSGSVASFELGVAGLTMKVNDARFENNIFKAGTVALKTPDAWGGAEVTLYNVAISSSGISIGGGKFALPQIKAGGFTIQAEGELKQVNGGYEIFASGLFKIPGMEGGSGCQGIRAALTIYTDSLGATVMDIEPLDKAMPPQQFTASVENPELAALHLRNVEVELFCSIPIGNTGFDATGLKGSLTLSSGNTRVDVSITVQTKFTLPVVGPAIKATANAYIQASPFEMGLKGALHVFVMQVGGANVTISERSGFSAKVWIKMYVAKGDLELNAWSDYRGFNLTGKAELLVGFDRGSIWRGCLPNYPCGTHWSCGECCWEKICWPSGVQWCNGPCINVPPSTLEFGPIGTEFGKFTRNNNDWDTKWGFKGYARMNFAGNEYGASFFIDYRGDLSVGNVDNIRLVTRSQVQQAYGAWQAALASGEANLSATRWEHDSIAFLSQTEAALSVPITYTSSVIFSLSRNTATPHLSLQQPDGTTITPDNLPDGVGYTEIITYQHAPIVLPANLQALVANTTAASDNSGEVRIGDAATPCQMQSVTVADSTIADSGVRLINAITGTVNVDILLDGTLLKSSIAPGATSSYGYETPGTRTITVVPTGKTEPVLARTQVPLVNGTYQTLILTGDGNGNYYLVTLTDDNTTPVEGQARMRFVNVGTGLSRVDVGIENEYVMYQGIANGSASDYETLEPGTYTFVVMEAGSANELMRVPNVQLVADDVTTMMIVPIPSPTTTNQHTVYLPLVQLMRDSNRTTSAINDTMSKSSAPVSYNTLLQQTNSITSTTANQLVTVTDMSPYANLRVVNASHITDPLAVALNDSVAPVAETFGKASNYVSFEPGSVRVLVQTQATSVTMLNQSMALARKTDYTLVMLPSAGTAIDPLLLTDNNNFPSIDHAKLRVVHGDVDMTAVNAVAVNANGTETVLGSNMSYKHATGYTELLSGTYRLELRDPSTAATVVSFDARMLKEGNVYTLFAFDADGTAGDTQLLLETDVNSIRMTQESYVVEKATPGTWQMLVDGEGVGGANTNDPNANYLLQVSGSNPRPTISMPTATRVGNTMDIDVTWKVQSDEPATINIYASPGPVLVTQTITNANGTTSDVIRPYYTGQKIASGIPADITGQVQSARVTLTRNETGRYYIWLEADDDRNAPTRIFVRKPAAEAALQQAYLDALQADSGTVRTAAEAPLYRVSDVDDNDAATFTEEDLLTFDIDHDTTWAITWTTRISTTADYRSLSVSWDEHDNPDVEGYNLLVQGAGITGTHTIATGDLTVGVIDALQPGTTYTIQVEAYDLENNRTSLSQPISATTAIAPFTLHGPADLGTIRRNTVPASITLQTPLTHYPTPVDVTVVDLAPGLSITFTHKIEVPCGDSGVIVKEWFCPTFGGTDIMMDITTNGTMMSGVYSITVMAQGGGITQTLTMPITVEGADFALKLSPDYLEVPLDPNQYVETTLTLDGYNDADDPVWLDGWSNDWFDVTFWQNGTQLLTPTMVAGDEITVRVQAITDDEDLQPIGDAEIEVDDYSSIYVDGYSSIYAEYAKAKVLVFDPLPRIDDVGVLYPHETIQEGESAIFSKWVTIPSTWKDKLPLTLRVPASYNGKALPAGATVLMKFANESDAAYATTLTLTSVGKYLVQFKVTAAIPTAKGVYDVWTQIVDKNGNVVRAKFGTLLSVNVPKMDFDADEDNLHEMTVFPGEDAVFPLTVVVPDDWTTPVSITLEPDYFQAAVVEDVFFVVPNHSIYGEPSHYVEVGPGTTEVEVIVKTNPYIPFATGLFRVYLDSGLVYNTSNFRVNVDLDFDTDDDNKQVAQVTLGQPISFTVDVDIPTSWQRPLVLAVTPEVDDPNVPVTFQVEELGGTPVSELVLTEPGSYHVVVYITPNENARLLPGDKYIVWLDYVDQQMDILMNWTTFELQVE